MQDIINYIKPELLVVSIVLYFIGLALKNTTFISDHLIPIIIGIVGVLLCGIWVFSTSDISGYQNILFALFTSVVQGILVAGLSNYVNQIIKQIQKGE